jgi:NAD(P)H-nitrite reductase large subunit
MKFADGSELETDIILFSAGIRPRDELARSSGLALGERGVSRLMIIAKPQMKIFMRLVNVRFGTIKSMV